VTVTVRLVGFAALLVLVFGGAAFAGSRIDVHPGKTEQRDAMEGEHGATATQAVRGLSVSDGGLTLDLADRAKPEAGKPLDLSFRIVDAEGRAVRDFDVEHTKRMHVIVVRRDMTGFQHLHPTRRADGTWTAPVTLAEPGTYRVFADFAVDGDKYTLADDLAVDGTVRSRPLPAPADEATTDGFCVTRTGSGDELAFEVTRAGRPVAVEDYLGAKGHLVALRQGDLAFLHVHPHADELAFTAEFPTPGTYRLFLQFKVDGRVHTAAFTEEVAR
jgi:hypothetical protein